MKEWTCLIVDDEEPARNLMENYINRLPFLKIVGKCANPLEALAILQTQTVELIFLDIQMPELTGVEFLKTLTQRPKVIFTTAYKEYALEGYELEVVDYLLKPFRFERFLQAVNKATKLLSLERQEHLPNTPVEEPEIKAVHRDHVLVKSDFKVYRIYFKDILYIESMKEYVAYHTLSQGRILSLGSLKNLEATLPKDQFMRVHKSYMIAQDKVSALEGNTLLIGKERIPVGANYREQVKQVLFDAN
ncbi:MAG TPA: response regulator transcription factor [Saprospiraceae bacterium]|nr:response regulator transcription factor [Saprospiraceae bacterium]HMQ84436.1 response regulator transcription factor [Saprospiraceae bacterium]